MNSFYTNRLKKSTPNQSKARFRASPLNHCLIKAGLIFVFLFFCPPGVSAAAPNDQWYMLQEKVWNQIKAPQAWNYSTGTDRVTVAVIDTGVDIANPDLSPNIWLNSDEIADNGIDDDNNGYVDDMHGWNFVGKNNDVVPRGDSGGGRQQSETGKGLN